MAFYQNELSYGFNSLEPYIDELTMAEHYNALFKKYTDNLNDLVIEKNIETDDIEILIRNVLSYNDDKLRNNGGGYYNHLLYFENISPNNNDYNTYASEDLKRRIDKDLGGFQNLKDMFIEAGTNLFGAGWVWLVDIRNKLYVAKTKNQDNPLMSRDCNVLLGMDVWEHSYFLKHLSDRKSYIYDFFQVIDWNVVSNRL